MNTIPPFEANSIESLAKLLAEWAPDQTLVGY